MSVLRLYTTNRCTYQGARYEVDFIDQFKSLKDKEANALLFDYIENNRDKLFEELLAYDQPLKFWSMNPGNPDDKKYLASKESKNGGYAYLLTNPDQVKTALKSYSMSPHRYSGEFVLAIDDKLDHAQKRQSLVHKLQDLEIETRMDAAVEVSWQKFVAKNKISAQKTELDLLSFFRDVALHFTGSYFGIPEGEIFPPNKLANWSGVGFQEYIWKIHARHFVKDRPEKDQAIKHISELIGYCLRTSPDNTVIGRFRSDHGAFSNAALSGKNRFNIDSAEYQNSWKKPVVSNILGSIQGLIDNVAGSGCYALNWLLTKPTSDKTIKKREYIELKDLRSSANNDSPIALREYLHMAHRGDTPSPFLPRFTSDYDPLFGSEEEFGKGVQLSCAIGAAIAGMSDSDYKVQGKWDIRMGYGDHDCIGKYLGDELVLRAMRKILSLDELADPKLVKQWGWIVKAFTVKGKQSKKVDANVAADEYAIKNQYIQPAIIVGAKTTSSLLSDGPDIKADVIGTISGKELNSLPDSYFSQMSGDQIERLSVGQIEWLSYSQVSALDKRYRELVSCKLNAEQKSAIARRISYMAVRVAANQAKPRPHAFSLWSHEQDPLQVSDYTSWPGLTDYKFTARHLPPAVPGYAAKLPEDTAFESPASMGRITSLFKYDEKKAKGSRSSLLFPIFAQWFTDSFLRTDRQDRRRNTSNHEIDMCQIYGLTEDVTRILRANDGSGELKSEEIDGNWFPPRLFDKNGNIKAEFNQLPYVKNSRILEIIGAAPGGISRKQDFFVAGLERGNSTFGYSALNTLFLREHNRICKLLKTSNVYWDDERIFQTARMIVILLELKIVVAEYINHIVAPPDQDEALPQGRRFVFDQSFAEREPWYRTNHIAIEFNLLYRWHSLIPNKFTLGQRDYSPLEYMTNNTPLVEAGLDGVLLGMSAQNVQSANLNSTPDFLLAAEYEALKMARDFKIQSFNSYRHYFGLPPLTSFKQLGCSDGDQIKLEKLYGHIDNLEFMVGLYAERPTGGSLFGQLMGSMVSQDAFSQALTNPLLSRNVFNKETLTSLGLEIIKGTGCLHDIWARNMDDNPLHESKHKKVTMDFTG